MEVRYNRDEDTGQPRIYQHGVREHEVEQVLARPGEDRAGSEGTRVVIGQTHAGRYLRVICAPDDDGQGVFVITAYALRGCVRCWCENSFSHLDSRESLPAESAIAMLQPLSHTL
jgi:hypothetical protein